MRRIALFWMYSLLGLIDSHILFILRSFHSYWRCGFARAASDRGEAVISVAATPVAGE